MNDHEDGSGDGSGAGCICPGESEDLACTVCSETYGAGAKEPVVLPHCGHTFCRRCLVNLRSMSHALKCPTCRKKHKGVPISQLPTNFTVLNLATSHNHRKCGSESCLQHGDQLGLWCCVCQLPLCGQCLFENHMTHGYQVVKVKDAIREKKQNIAEQTAVILQKVERERETLTREVHLMTHQLARLYSRSTYLTTCAKEAEKILQNVRRTTHIRSILANHNSLEHILSDLNIKANNNDHALKPPDLPKIELDNKDNKDNKDNATADNAPSTPSTKEKDSRRASIRSNYSPNKSASSHTLAVVNLDVMRNSPSDLDTDEEKGAKLFEDDKLSATTEGDTDTDSGMETDTKHEAKGSEVTWQLKRSVGGSTQWPYIDWLEFRNQLPAVQLLAPPEWPEVCLVLATGTKHLGRVHIRLWGHLRRAQHFLALCLGTLGPTYKGSRFTNVARKGAPGESLVGGRYATPSGSSSYGLFAGLEWRGSHSGPVTRGVLGGASDGDPASEALFGICTRAYPEGEYYCPFGEVVAGLDVVERAVCHNPVTDITITDINTIADKTKPK